MSTESISKALLPPANEPEEAIAIKQPEPQNEDDALPSYTT